MEYEITTELTNINFAPDTVTEILQNVRTIVTTTIKSVPLYRDFGVDFNMLDMPIPIAQAKLTAAIISAVPKWEPRARVTKVTYEGDGAEGILVPKVQVRVIDS